MQGRAQSRASSQRIARRGWRRRFVALVLCVPLVVECDSFGASRDPIASSPVLLNTRRVERAKSILEAHMQRGLELGHYPTLAAGVVVNQDLVYENYVRTDGHRTYYLASITKTFTATAIMQLVDRGLIELDDPIQKYFPRLELRQPELNSEPVRIRHLLSHTSGLPDMRYFSDADWIEPEESGLTHKVPRQIYPTGHHYRYANHGFMILGDLVQKRTGMSLQEYYQTQIFEPIGMRDAGFSDRLSGAFGIYASLYDMAQYAKLWLNGGRNETGDQIVSAESVHRMMQPPLFFPEGTNIPYCGLGWRVQREGPEVQTFFHIGGANGTQTWIQMFPRERAAIIYLGNPPKMSDEVMNRIPPLQYKLSYLATAIIGQDKPAHHFEASVASEDVTAMLAGRYVDAFSDREIQITINENGRAILSWRGGRTESLAPVTTRIFSGQQSHIWYDFPFMSDRDHAVGIATAQAYFRRVGDATANSERTR